MEKKKLVILDGNSLLNRAFYALPPMITSKNHPTGAIYGLTTMLFKIYNEIKPDYIAAAFDLKAPTFRHIQYTDYKAGRKKMPDELAAQFAPAKELLKAFNIGIFEQEGFEADDLIGTISKSMEGENLEVIIFTGDKDALQLVSEYTKVMITKKGITDIDIYDKEAIREKYGFEPSGIIELKGLMGDASDNIPGVPGVGEKTALKLLNEYGDIEEVYKNVDKISGKKLKENLIAHKEDAFMSRELATINRNVPIEIDLDNLIIHNYDPKKVRELFLEFEFRSLMDRVKEDSSENEVQGNEILDDVVQYNGDSDVINKIKENKIFNFIFHTLENKETIMVIEDGIYVLENDLLKFKEIFEDNDIVKNTYSAKQVLSCLNKKNISLKNLAFDGEIAAYILNPSEAKYEIVNILNRYGEINYINSNQDNILNVMALFANKLSLVKEKMLDDIRGYNMEHLFYDVEMPLVECLSSMEISGFKVDKDTLRNIGFQLSEEIDSLTSQIYDYAGEEFNINSPKQLGVVLFEKLELPVIKKTKTGYSTDAEVLDQLSSKHEIVDKILSYRQLVKLKSTYIDGLISNIEADGKIHSSFNQTVTATGRISSTEPNLQNIPIKMEQGRQIRRAFIPKSDEYLILSADYSQIELRVLAHISEDKNLIDAFVNNQDIHRRTASEVFGIPMDEVTSLQRSRAKAVNFGIVYGLSDFGLSKDLKIPIKEAKSYIENYFNRYQGVKNYLDKVIEEAKESGYVTTLMNRIRYIPEIKSTNRTIKMFGERLAMNTPIQGTAADIIKIAMVRVYERLKNEKLKSSLILQVHDELVLEVHRSELEYVKKLVKDEMEGAMNLAVPLAVDINIGTNWYETK